MRLARSRSHAVDKFRCRRHWTSARGFGLVEVLFATLVLSVGVVGVASLLVITTQLHIDGRAAAQSTREAQTKIDELMKLNLATAPAVQITGVDSLTNNIANYFDTPVAGVTRRWLVQGGPTANTRVLTVRVINTRAVRSGRQVDLVTILRQW